MVEGPDGGDPPAAVTLAPPTGSGESARGIGRHAAETYEGGSVMRVPQLDRKSWILLALFTGLSIFAGGPWSIPPAAWLAPVFGLRFFRTQEQARRGYWLLVSGAYLASVIGAHGTTIFYYALAGVHIVLATAIEMVFLAVVVPIAMLVFAVDRWVLRRWFDRAGRPPFAATLVFPLAMTAVDFGGGGGPLGTFGAVGYSQYGWLPVMQLGAVAGLWGIGFLMAWFASVVNYVWESGFRWRESARGVVAYGSVLVLVLAFGVGRLWASPSAETEIRVVGMTSHLDIPDANSPTYETDTAALHNDYLARTRAAAERGAQIVVWPESGAMGTHDEVEALLANARWLAREYGIYLVVTTVPYVDAEGFTDTVLHIIDPQGEIALTHVKYGGTDFAVMLGQRDPVPRELQALETPLGTLSGIVCWDADYPDTVRQAGRLGIDLLFVPSNDWYELRNVHAQMAVFRAVENGVSIVRQTSNGVSLTADAYGRVLSYADTFQGELEQDVRVPLNATATIYPRVGDAVGWAALLGTALLVIATWIKGRSDKKTRKEPVGPPAGHRVMTKTGP